MMLANILKVANVSLLSIHSDLSSVHWLLVQTGLSLRVDVRVFTWRRSNSQRSKRYGPILAIEDRWSSMLHNGALLIWKLFDQNKINKDLLLSASDGLLSESIAG